ncbi:MAG: VCBS repeat-containing protein, partial [Bacteroidota bacterium]|nr:VCBS repeat-containing protein [Bacteroidota bacterium]
NSYIRNDGNGKFTLSALPSETQYSCMNGMVTEDFDHDGNLDVLMIGNDYGTEVSVGRYDGCNGLFLKGDGNGGFKPATIVQSGWFVPGDAKALVKLRSSNNKCLLIASQHKGSLKAFMVNKDAKYLPVTSTEISAVVTYKNGKRQKRELSYGASFLSQSGRFLNLDENISKVEIRDYKGSIRTINL